MVSYSQRYQVNFRASEFGYCDQWLPSALKFSEVKSILQEEVDEETKPILQKASLNGDPWKEVLMPFNSLKNHIRSLYLQKLCFEEFDLGSSVMITRHDLFFHDELFIEPKTLKEVNTPSWNTWGGLNDRLAILTGLGVNAYLNRYSKIDEFLRTSNWLHSETFLDWATRDMTRSSQVSTRASRVRLNGLLKDENFSA